MTHPTPTPINSNLLSPTREKLKIISMVYAFMIFLHFVPSMVPLTQLPIPFYSITMILLSSKHPTSKHSQDLILIRWMRDFDKYLESLLGSKIIIIRFHKTTNKFKANIYRVLHLLQVRRNSMILLRKFPSSSKLNLLLINKSPKKHLHSLRKKNNFLPNRLQKLMKSHSLKGLPATARRQNVLSSIVIVSGRT